MLSSSILLNNGIVLLHDQENHVVPTKTSILIEGDRISKIANDISVDLGTRVIDCTDKIISPGFIDTHHHCWQTQLKGRHENELLMEYMISGNAQLIQYDTKDIFYGQLSSMLESLSAGTTTVIDHAHLTQSQAHAEWAIAGTVSSGIRSIYCYTPISRVKRFNPMEFFDDLFEDWVMQTFAKLAHEGPWADGRVTLGFGYDLWFMPQQVTQEIFAIVKKAGVKTVTSHFVSVPQIGKYMESLPKLIQDLGLLDEHFIFSHANGCTKDDIEVIKKAGAHISSTPSTELQMGMGRPLCFDAAFLDGGPSRRSIGVQSNASLGIDCHSNNGGSIVSEARQGLQNARNHYNEFFIQRDKTTYSLPSSLSVEAAFNLATLKGAEAIGMSTSVGRIKEGYMADLVIFDALSPAMVCAAQQDPVAAIILHSTPADIDTVIIGGVIRKSEGKLTDVTLEHAARGIFEREKMAWSDIAKEAIKSWNIICKKIDKVDKVEGSDRLFKTWGVDKAKFVDRD